MASTMMAPNGMVVLTMPNNTYLHLPGQKTEVQLRFEKGEPKALGVVQILIGLLLVCCGALLLNNPLSSAYSISGVPFWGVAFFIISGAISVAAENKGTMGLVRVSMAMNIVSFIISVSAIILISVDILVIYINLSESSACDGYYPGNDGRACYIYRDGLLAQRNGVLGLALILTTLEFCTTLSTSIFACKAVCGCCGAPQETQPMVVVQNTYGQQLAYPPPAPLPEASVQNTYGQQLAYPPPVPSPEASAASPPAYYDNNDVRIKS